MADQFVPIKGQEGSGAVIGPGGTPFVYRGGAPEDTPGEPVFDLSYGQRLEAQRQQNIRLDREYGPTGAFAMGALGGGGLFSGAAIRLADAFGDHETAQGLRDDYEGIQGKYPFAYQSGDFAGLMALSELTGGFGGAAAAERIGATGVRTALEKGAAKEAIGAAQNAVAKSSGILSGMGRSAAKWGAEGGAMNLFHEIGDSAIQNKPLTWQQAASSYGGGFLFGGILGAGAHGLMEVGKAGIGAAMGRAFSKEATEKMVLRELGVGEEGYARLKARAEGPDAFIRHYRQLQEDFGEKAIGSKPEKVAKIAEENIKINKKVGDELIGDFAAKAGHHAPQAVSIPEAAASIAEKYMGLPEYEKISQVLGSEVKRIQTAGSGNFKLFEAARDSSMKRIESSLERAGLPQARAVVVSEKFGEAMDRELVQAMKGAEQVPGLEGAADRYAAARAAQRMSTEIRDYASKGIKSLQAPESALKPHDFGAIAAAATVGHPLSGVVYGIGKVIARGLEEKMHNAIANRMVDMHFTSKVLQGAGSTRAKIDSALNKFFSSGKTFGRQSAIKASRAIFEKHSHDAQALLSPSHMAEVKKVTDQMNLSHPGLGNEAFQSFIKARTVLEQNLLGARGIQNTISLTKKAIPKALDQAEHRFLRVFRTLMDPMSTLDDLASGKLSKESIQTLKDMAPDLYVDVIEQTTAKIAEMKQHGKSLGVSKVTQLGLLLNAPIDPILTSKHIGAVQASFQVQHDGPGRPPSPPGEKAESMQTESQEIEQ